MTHDPLKDLLNTAPVAQVPAHDLSFTIEVMAKVERKRLMESVALSLALAVVAGLILALVGPYLTPVLSGMAMAVAPVCGVLAALALCWYLYDQTQRFFRI